MPAGAASIAPERRALGQAVTARGHDVAGAVARALADGGRPERYSVAEDAVALVGRWLETGQEASPAELRAVALPSLPEVTGSQRVTVLARAFIAWREAMLAVVDEEAARLGTDPELRRLTRRVIRRSTDAGVVWLCRQCDSDRSRLEADLQGEQEKLTHQSLHDPLTGLPNRALLVDRLEHAIAGADRRGKDCALLFLDVDNFKMVNDRFGHRIGDALLLEVSRRLQAAVRVGDTVARLGGDEFVVLAEDLDRADQAAVLAERIGNSIADPVVLGDVELHTSASIGIAAVPPRSDPDVCLAQADLAMYQAKRRGRSRAVAYDTAIGAESERRAVLGEALHGVVERGELAVHYQPLFQLGSGIVGMEALVRWEHPVLGMISPAEFIPLAEESGAIVGIGRWVLRQATTQCRTWQLQGMGELTVAVNLSACQLRDASLIDDVRLALGASGLAPEHLVLEITESVLLHDLAEVTKILAKVRDLGVHLAIDDFGTGYSSLLYLRGLPVTSLKVDRAFVSGLGAQGQDAAIVAAIVRLAHTLGLTVVAEGVETQAELAALDDMGCDQAQGFLLGRPAPAPQFGASEVIRALAANSGS